MHALLGGDALDSRLIETWRLHDRRLLLDATGWLVRDWPHRLLACVDDAGLGSATLLRDRDTAPPLWAALVRQYRMAPGGRRGGRGPRLPARAVFTAVPTSGC
jgi:hypothetical protein